MEAHPWLGAVAGGIRVGRLKHVLTALRSGGTPESGNSAFWAEDGTPWVAISDMSGTERIESTSKSVTQAGIADKRLEVLQPGTLLYSIYASLGHVSELAIPATTNQAILGLSFDEAVARRYAFWQLKALQPYVVESASSNTQDNLNAEKVRNLPFAIPSIAHQTRIANFLDEKTARIDALIAEKERLVERVGEQADAQVSDLVCGSGLSHESYRETGWRFLPKIPAHWQLCHLRWIAKRVDVGIAEAATHAYADEGVPILRSTNVRPNSIAGTLLRIQPWFAEKNSSKTLYENDLVTVRTGYPGVTAVVPKELDGCQCFTLLISSLEDGYLPSFYARYLNAAAARGYFAVESWGSARSGSVRLNRFPREISGCLVG